MMGIIESSPIAKEATVSAPSETVKKVLNIIRWARRAMLAQPTHCGFAQFRVSRNKQNR